MARSTATMPSSIDLLRLPLLGRFLQWRHARAALQWPLLLLAALLIYDGLMGPQVAPRNLAGVIPWVHVRGLTVLALLVAGNLTCMACPFMLSRNLAKRFLPANRPWPARLNGKPLAIGLLLFFFWYYETFDPWASPWLTAMIALVYFGAAFVVDGLFKGAAFCRYLCPIGQFNFVNSLASPLEVRRRSASVCAGCATKECITGAVEPEGAPVRRRSLRGCELWLFQEKKVGNMDCTFCLDCIHACPYDNVGIVGRMPAAELWEDRRRSGVGRLAERRDLAVMVVVIVFAAFMNAFGMVSPFHGFAETVSGLLGTRSEGVVLAAILAAGLLLAPLVLMGTAAAASRGLSRARESLVGNAVAFSYSLVPLGFGMWLAHYGFHFLTGALTLLPVAQSLLVELGAPILGPPRWGLASLVPAAWLVPIELVMLELGFLGSLLAAYRITALRYGGRSGRWASLPWGLLALALFAVGVWLMLQPMEMRGTFGGG